jgi:hypothetical protein
MWRRYFGEGCHLHGIDLDPRVRAYEDANTTIHIGDQADVAFWKRFKSAVKPLNIFIDDGGHRAKQQIVTFEQVFPHLAPGGVFICEDVHGAGHLFSAYTEQLAALMHSEAFGEGDGSGRFPAQGIQRWIESISVYPFMVVVEKRRLPTTTLHSCRMGTEWQPAELAGPDGRQVAGRGV